MKLIIKKRAGNKRRPFHFVWFLMDFIEAMTMVFIGLVVAFLLGAIIFGLAYIFVVNSMVNSI